MLFHDRGQFGGLFARNCPRSWSVPGRPRGLLGSADPARLPDRTVVVRFELRDEPAGSYWLLLRKPQPELCTRGTGYVEDIVARTDAACLIDIHLKRTSYREALRDGRLALDGPPQLTGAFMTWIRPSPYAGITAAPSARPSGIRG